MKLKFTTRGNWFLLLLLGLAQPTLSGETSLTNVSPTNWWIKTQTIIENYPGTTQLQVHNPQKGWTLTIAGVFTVKMSLDLAKDLGSDLVVLIGILSKVMWVGNREFRSRSASATFVLLISDGEPEMILVVDGGGMTRPFVVLLDHGKIIFFMVYLGETLIFGKEIFANGNHGNLLFSIIPFDNSVFWNTFESEFSNGLDEIVVFSTLSIETFIGIIQSNWLQEGNSEEWLDSTDTELADRNGLTNLVEVFIVEGPPTPPAPPDSGLPQN